MCVCSRVCFLSTGESVVKYDVKKEWYLPPDRRVGGDLYTYTCTRMQTYVCTPHTHRPVYLVCNHIYETNCFYKITANHNGTPKTDVFKAKVNELKQLPFPPPYRAILWTGGITASRHSRFWCCSRLDILRTSLFCVATMKADKLHRCGCFFFFEKPPSRCLCLYMNELMCVCVCACVRVHIHTHAHTHVYGFYEECLRKYGY